MQKQDAGSAGMAGPIVKFPLLGIAGNGGHIFQGDQSIAMSGA
jgi:hypothetical protein